VIAARQQVGYGGGADWGAGAGGLAAGRHQQQRHSWAPVRTLGLSLFGS